MKKVNEIVICRSSFKSQEEFENSIRDAVMLLLKNDYIMTIHYDEPGLGIVSIEYNYANREYGDTYPHWLTPEEEDLFYSSKWEDE